MDIRIHESVLPHTDPDASLSFYRDLLNHATADLDGTFARLEVGGAEAVQEPTEQPDGLRDCAFGDPAGNLLRSQELR